MTNIRLLVGGPATVLIRRVFLGVLIAGFAGSAATAAPIFYVDIGGSSAGFEVAADDAGIALTVDDFEDLAAGTVDYGLNFARAQYSISATSGIGLRSTDSPGFVIEGSRSMILYSGSDPLTFAMNSPVNAFAITFADLDLVAFGTGEFTVSIDGGESQTLLGDEAGDNLVYFFGVIDEAATFSTISFNRTVNDGYDFDIVNLGEVSEPASPTLAAFGFVALAAFAWRRRKR